MQRKPPTSPDDNENAISGHGIGSWSIENAGFRDLRKVAAIQSASFRPGLAYRVATLFILWALPIVTFLVAKHQQNGEVVGCVIGDRYRGNLRIMNLAVHPDWRRQGIASALLQAIGDRHPEGNIELMVEEPNRGAQALYELMGFVQTGYKRNYYGKHRHGIEMTLLRGIPPIPRNGKPTSGRIRI